MQKTTVHPTAPCFRLPRPLLAAAILCAAAMLLNCPKDARAQCGELSQGQLLYVAAYSHTSPESIKRTIFYSITLSIHNIDPKQPITITEVEYYSIQGKRIRGYLTKPRILAPLETVEFTIQDIGNEGSSGDNFMVRWQSSQPANPPLVESIMLGTAMGQGISFTSRAVPIIE